MDLRVGWRDPQIRRDHLAAVENDRPGHLVFLREEVRGALVVRHGQDGDNRQIFAVLRLCLHQQIRETQAGETVRRDDIDDQHLAPIVLRIVLLVMRIRQ